METKVPNEGASWGRLSGNPIADKLLGALEDSDNIGSAAGGFCEAWVSETPVTELSWGVGVTAGEAAEGFAASIKYCKEVKRSTIKKTDQRWQTYFASIDKCLSNETTKCCVCVYSRFLKVDKTLIFFSGK